MIDVAGGIILALFCLVLLALFGQIAAYLVAAIAVYALLAWIARDPLEAFEGIGATIGLVVVFFLTMPPAPTPQPTQPPQPKSPPSP